MRGAEKALQQAAVAIILLLTVSVTAAGCGKQAATEPEATGIPAVLNFWQPG